MKAAVFHKPKDIKVDTVDDTRIDDTRDVILKVNSTAICGSDLHIYNGMFPQVKDLIMGHEFMGIVEEDIITHKLPLSDASHAYDIFNNEEDDCVKVVLKP
jgi:threonine dehydrogenase-like Zn-dependent dehydrogenase